VSCIITCDTKETSIPRAVVFVSAGRPSLLLVEKGTCGKGNT